MPILLLSRAIAGRIVASPLGVIAIVGLLAAWPLLFVLAPNGISSSRIVPAEWFYELAFMGQALGVLLGGSALARLAPLLAREPSFSRWATEWLLLFAFGALGSFLALLPGMMWAWSLPAVHSISPWVAAAPALVATASASTALARLRIQPATAIWLLATGLLLAPMLLSQPIPARTPILLGAAFALAAQLLDRPPRDAR